jgi:uncharacterized protein (DUF924 family)
MQSADQVISFWFDDHNSEDWFGAKAEFDAKVSESFRLLLPKVAHGEAWAWRETADGRVAEIIVLDQFSRQLHRGSPLAFANDAMALALAQEAVSQGFDQKLPLPKRMFLYMPYMHAESIIIQNEGVKLFAQFGPEQLKFMNEHAETIARFGRFPMRNAALGRENTPDELAYITERQGKMY